MRSWSIYVVVVVVVVVAVVVAVVVRAYTSQLIVARNCNIHVQSSRGNICVICCLLLLLM